ncbi:MAG: bifunctional phosphoribosyl-AMP cyclohydrolase/phosphoribosyl-ATP diphosphatase HisIE [Zhaonellaceae bacterium]|jgi:phosphoribosyl-ATP pyrophosphohydrolase/phosphoribosyl-AMP cyclohydrolase
MKEIKSISELTYNDKGLIPAIIQDVDTGQVLMLAYMNQESLQKSLETGETWFFSRSRQELWHKGATSGHIQKIDKIYYDCDQDTLLILVEQIGGIACHEGVESCFHYELVKEGEGKTSSGVPSFDQTDLGSILTDLYSLIDERQQERPEGSYTTYLFDKGLDKILKKVGEEAAEVIIAAKNRSADELTYEASDLLYHLLVLLVEQKVSLSEIAGELAGRRK